LQNNKFDNSIVLLSAIGIISAAGIIFVYLAATSRLDVLRISLGENHVVNTLFVVEYKNKPVATYVTLFNAGTRRAALFDIPPDVGRILKQVNRVDRIDTVYDGRRLKEYVTEVENLLGVDVYDTVVFDLDALSKIVDIIDGVRVFIPTRVTIYDSENSVIFPAGWTELDGAKTKAYLLYEEEDDTSVARQWRNRFFIGLLKRVGEKNLYLKKEGVEKYINALIKTSMNKKVRARFFDNWAYIDADRISVQQISGNYREISGKHLLLPHYDGGLIKDIIRQTLNTLTRQSGRTLADRVITVEVLNGTTTAGLAGATAEMIRGFGYDVINIDNADRSDYDTTTIIDHANNEEEALNFAEIIHSKTIITDTALDEFDSGVQSYEYKADITLILGRDYNGRFNK
jgi:anionic cell wall polymer biosynthesis LytR-Cps2A-Psr (LCP) family protein